VVKSPPKTNPKAPYSTFFVFAIPSYTGRYHEFNFLINLLENELGFLFRFQKTRNNGNIGKNKYHGPTKAKLKVIAIGLNILPSIPERERIGINTIKMINCKKSPNSF
jgi:hypothetical protein